MIRHGDTITPRPYATHWHLQVVPIDPALAEAARESARAAHHRDLAGMSDDDGARAESVIVWAAVAVLAVSIVGIACAFL